MNFSLMPMEQKVTLFSSTILCCHNLYYSIYTKDHQILFRNAPEGFPLGQLLANSVDWEKIDLPADPGHHPAILSARLGISWILIPLQDSCHMLWPFFLTSMSPADIGVSLKNHGFSLPAKRKIPSLWP